MTRDNALKFPCVNLLGVPGHSTEETDMNRRNPARETIRSIPLVLALAPNEILVEFGVGVELLGEDAGLALLGLVVLFESGQVEDQVGDDEGL